MILVTKMPTPIKIEMDEYEARILARVLNRVGGDQNGPRAVISNLAKKLVDAGIAPDNEICASGEVYLFNEAKR